MSKKSAFAAMVLLSFLTAANGFPEPNMREGNWEIMVATEMKGMPFPIPPQSFSACLDKNQLVPQQPEKDGSCRVGNMRINGDKVNWETDCKDPKGISLLSEGEITYSGETFVGTVHTVIDNPQGKMQMMNQMKGRYIGPCPK